MQAISGGQRRNNARSSKSKSYDYSSRIFYPTEGHPQYIGLPADHPDPEDEEAVAKYHARNRGGKGSRRSGPRPPRRGKDVNHRQPRERQEDQSRKGQAPSHQGQQQQPRPKHHQPKSPDKQAHVQEQREKPNQPAPPPENAPEKKKRTRTPAKKVEQESRSESRPARAKRTKASPPVQAASINEDDYEGTALIENQSTFSLVNQSLERALNNDPKEDKEPQTAKKRPSRKKTSDA